MDYELPKIFLSDPVTKVPCRKCGRLTIDWRFRYCAKCYIEFKAWMKKQERKEQTFERMNMAG